MASEKRRREHGYNLARLKTALELTYGSLGSRRKLLDTLYLRVSDNSELHLFLVCLSYNVRVYQRHQKVTYDSK